MADDPNSILFFDPLSSVARKERRYLLGASVIGIALVKLQIVPSKISALGIDFDYHEQKSFFGLFALVIAYFLVAFLVYALSDRESGRLHAFRERERRSITQKDYHRMVRYRMFQMRTVFDLYVPVLIAILAIVSLLRAEPPAKTTNTADPGKVTPTATPSVFTLTPSPAKPTPTPQPTADNGSRTTDKQKKL